MKSLLFEDPFWLYGILGLVLSALLVAWWRNRDRAHALRAAAAAGALGGLYLVSTLVVTDREKIQRATEDILSAVKAGAPDRVTAWLHRDLRVTLRGEALDRGKTEARLRQVLGHTRVSAVRVREHRIAVKGDRAFQQILTWLDLEGGVVRGRIPVRWRVHWVKTPGGWRVYEVEEPKVGLGR